MSTSPENRSRWISSGGAGGVAAASLQISGSSSTGGGSTSYSNSHIHGSSNKKAGSPNHPTVRLDAVAAEFIRIVEETHSDDWKRRIYAFDCVVKRIPAGAAYSDESNQWYNSPTVLRHLSLAISELLKDARSQLVKRACTNLTELFHKCQSDAKLLLKDLMPTILAVQAQTVLVIRQAVTTMVLESLPQVPCKSVMPLWMDRIKQDKSKTVREACITYLLCALQSWSDEPGYFSDEVWTQVGTVLIKSLRDPSQPVRETAKVTLEFIQSTQASTYHALINNPDGPAAKDPRLQRWLQQLGQDNQHQDIIGTTNDEEWSVASKISYNSDTRFVARPSTGVLGTTAVSTTTLRMSSPRRPLAPTPSSSSQTMPPQRMRSSSSASQQHPPLPPTSDAVPSSIQVTTSTAGASLASRGAPPPRTAGRALAAALMAKRAAAASTAATPTKPRSRSSSTGLGPPLRPMQITTPAAASSSPCLDPIQDVSESNLALGEESERGGTGRLGMTMVTEPRGVNNNLNREEWFEGEIVLTGPVDYGSTASSTFSPEPTSPEFPSSLPEAFSAPLVGGMTHDRSSSSLRVDTSFLAGDTSQVKLEATFMPAKDVSTLPSSQKPTTVAPTAAAAAATPEKSSPIRSVTASPLPTVEDSSPISNANRVMWDRAGTSTREPAVSSPLIADDAAAATTGGSFIASVDELKQHASKRRSRNSILIQERFRRSSSKLHDSSSFGSFRESAESDAALTEQDLADLEVIGNQELDFVNAPDGESPQHTLHGPTIKNGNGQAPSSTSSSHVIEDKINGNQAKDMVVPVALPDDGAPVMSSLRLPIQEQKQAPLLVPAEHVLIAVRLLRAHKLHVDQIMETLRVEMDALRDFDQLLEQPGHPTEDEVLTYFESVGLCLEQRTQSGLFLQNEMDRISRGDPPLVDTSIPAVTSNLSDDEQDTQR